MFRTIVTGLTIAAALAGTGLAETYEVKMLNRGDDGPMVFEPAYLNLEPGDTVRFLATDRGHNAETIDGMLPEGVEGFEGRINEEIEYTFDTEGYYGIRCKPHYAMGMVMTIAVGDGEAPDAFLEGRVPRKALERFEAQLAGL